MLLILLIFAILMGDKAFTAGQSTHMSSRNFVKTKVSSANFRIEKSVPNIR